jgi:hypothetical protein
MFSVIGQVFAITRTFLEEAAMKFSILFTLFFFFACTDKDDSDDNTNNSNLTPSFCEAIQDRDTCNQAGCIAIRQSFDIVDSQGNCIQRLQSGNICLLGESHNYNNEEPEIYYKGFRNGMTIGMTSSNFSSLDGWSNIHTFEDYCCRMDPEGCAETPWVDATDQWYPFEGLLD